jgi:hypothetical protein
MFDLRRLGMPFLSLVLVALAMAPFSALSLAGVLRWPSRLKPTDPMIVNGDLQHVGRRLVAIRRELEKAPPTSSQKLGVLLGSSTVLFALDPEILEEDSKVPMRWVNLGCENANAADTARLARLVVEDGGLKPDFVVLALHPDQLPRTTSFLVESMKFSPSELLGDLKRLRYRRVQDHVERAALAPLDVFFPYRTLIGYRSREVATDWKVAIFRTLGMGLDSIYAPDPSPWTSRTLFTRPVATRDVPSKFQACARFGTFDEPNYEADRDNVQSIAKLLRDFGDEVNFCVLIVPQRSELRGVLPPIAMQRLLDVVKPAAAAGKLLDLHESLPDDLFFDHVHVGPAGRELTSRRLAKFLKPRIAALESAASTPPAHPNR